MNALIVYPKEYTFDFNVPCLESKGGTERDILPFVVRGLVYEDSQLVKEMGVRNMGWADMVCVNGKWFYFGGIEGGLARWYPITRKIALYYQTTTSTEIPRSEVIHTNTDPFA